MCGADRPQVHHIDEDPSNNELLNLLPLCPNFHLTDQHNPTVRIQPERLKLFRAHKDPMILNHQFAPLFRRLNFFDHITDSHDVDQLQASVKELCQFVLALDMGAFYSGQIAELTKYRPHFYAGTLGGPDPEYEARVRRHHQEYREQLRRVRDEVYALAVELLRYQDRWNDRAHQT
jgi:hypothetical protein